MPLSLAALLLAAVAAAAPAPKAARTVTFAAADGWTIAADYHSARGGRATLILAHGVASSRSEWEPLTKLLAEKGVGTLALDLRGHGGSLQSPTGPRDYKDFDSTGEWPRSVLDLEAAAAWLKSRGVAPARIALGGASIGANLASLAAAGRPKTPFLLLLSPGPDYRGARLQRPRTRTLAVASPGDEYARQTLAPLSAIKGVDILEAPGGHGTQVFADPATLGKIADWIVAASGPAR